MRNLIFKIMIFSGIVTSCVSVTPEEQKAIQTLNEKFPKYEISHYDYIIGNYLRMRIKEHGVDSNEIKHVYLEAMNLGDQSSGAGRFVWSHLIVYDSANNYLFTVLGDSNKIKFFKDSVN